MNTKGRSNMKKKTNFSKIINVMLSTALVLMSMVFAAPNVQAANMYEQQPVYINASGQRVLDVTYNGSTVLEVVAKNGNVYNVTNKFLVTSTCKGPDYVGVAYNSQLATLVILWVDQSGTLWRTPATYLQNTAQGQYTGGAINTVTSSNYNGSGSSSTSTTGYGYNPNYGYNQNGSYNSGYGYNQNGGNSSYCPSNNNNKYDAYVTVSGSTYKIYDGSKTYTYKLSKDELSYNGTEIADDVEAIAFTEEYVIYFTDDNEAWAVELGRKSKGDMILEDIEKVTYVAGSGLLDYIKADGKKYDEDDVEDLIDDSDDKDSDYPYVKKSSKKYTFYKASSKKYTYEYDGDAVEYDDKKLCDDVEEIAFSEDGYLYMLTEDGDLYNCKVGSTTAKKVDSDIDRISSSKYIVKYVYDEDNNKINVEKEYE
jgi:hypothetical protein